MVLGLVPVASLAQGALPPGVELKADIPFARFVSKGAERVLHLDLYRPDVSRAVAQRGVVMWIHGGAWRAGSRKSMPIPKLVLRGWSIASVEYRLSPEARFPAQAHDLNAAVRYLRANAKKLRIDARRIVVAGNSAGGHLAALMGVINGVKKLEGNLGDHLDVSSDVQGIVDFYGPTNFHTILKQSTPHGLSVRVPALKLLLGAGPDEAKSLATLASPVSHVDSKDPPLLLIHGDQDPQVPINQAHELHGIYKMLRLPVQFEVVHGGAHGGKGFFGDDHIELMDQFLRKHLEKAESSSRR